MQRNKQAFTLIELLVVVLIIGILVAVAVPQYQVAVLKSRYSTFKSLTQSIAQAQETYYLSNGSYATEFESLDVTVPGKRTSTGTYTFSNGHCVLEEQANVHCGSYDIALIYQHNLIHSQRGALNSCFYMGQNIDSPAAKVCQQETGLRKPTSQTDNYMRFQY